MGSPVSIVVEIVTQHMEERDVNNIFTAAYKDEIHFTTTQTNWTQTFCLLEKSNSMENFRFQTIW